MAAWLAGYQALGLGAKAFDTTEDDAILASLA